MAWHDVPVIEIVLGRSGLHIRRNKNLVPLGSFKTLRNATLEDDSVRTAAGATPLGDAIGALTIQTAIDYWPTTAVQRTIVGLSDGSIRKDDGSGASWSSLASGLTTTGTVPFFALGGRELVGKNAKVFYCDRVNAVRVLSADAASMTTIGNPPADWNGTNQPGFLVAHDRWLFGAGNANDPKRIYRSAGDDHENFLLESWSQHIAGQYEYLAAGLSYKGGLLLFGYPEGVWFLSTESDNDRQWRPLRVGVAGASGPANVMAIEDDVLWIAPDGSLHLISATNATGSARAEDIAYEQLGEFLAENINLTQLATAQFVYYAHKRVAMLACHALGATTKNRRIELDVARVKDLGGRYTYHDRHRNEALFLRKTSGILTPHFGDASGQLWTMDRAARSDNGAGYTFEWQISDDDLARVIEDWAGKKKNGRFLQLEYDPRATAEHTIDVFRDGSLKQEITFALSAGPTALPVTLPVTLSEAILRTTRKRRLLGQATRWSFGGVSTVAGEDISLTKILVGLEAAE